MQTTVRRPQPVPGAEAEALIKEARRRQRMRHAVICLAAAAVLAGAVGAYAGLHGASQRGAARPPAARPPEGHPRPKPAPGRAASLQPPGPIPRSVDSAVLMWPVGYPLFGPGGGPPAYLDNLTTRRLVRHGIPGIAGGDFRPYAVTVGRWLVFVGNGVSAIRANLDGRPRVLGNTPFFATSATPGRIWLEYFRGDVLGQGPVRVRSVPVAGGPPGPEITLPAGASLTAGTDAGLLLEVRQHRMSFGLALWNPGAAPRVLPRSPSWGDGLAADARLIAYGTRCQVDVTAMNAPHDPNTGYNLCRTLRVFNVVTGRRRSFMAPRGTAGWVPDGFYTRDDIAPGNGMIAAEAKLYPTSQGSERLYVTRLAGRPQLVPVPSAAPRDASTAWSANGSWLLYQGPGGRM